MDNGQSVLQLEVCEGNVVISESVYVLDCYGICMASERKKGIVQEANAIGLHQGSGNHQSIGTHSDTVGVEISNAWNIIVKMVPDTGYRQKVGCWGVGKSAISEKVEECLVPRELSQV